MSHLSMQKRLVTTSAALLALMATSQVISHTAPAAVAALLDVVALLIAAGALYWLNSQFKRELGQLAGVAQGLADGQFEQRSGYTASDSVGVVARALNSLGDTLIQFRRAQAEMSAKHAEGWIDEAIDASRFRGGFAELARGQNELVAAHIAVKMQVVSVVTAYADGDYAKAMDRLPGKKAQITAAIDKVRDRLSDAALAAGQNARIRQALDVATTNVMIADADGNIQYMNQSVTEMLTAAEADIRRQLGQFEVRRVLGANFDIFHKNPAHQRNLLGQLRSTYKTEIQVSNRTFSLIANPIYDEGKRIGTVVEWRDRTAEVAVEKEVTRVVSGASQGDFTQRIDMAGKDGFFARLSQSINDLVSVSETGLNDVARVINAICHGDLTQTITADYQGTFGQLKNDVNLTVETLARTIGEVITAADSLTAASEQVSATAQSISQGATEQAAGVEQTSASVEQMSSSIAQNTENAKITDSMAAKAAREAAEGGDAVTRTVEAMKQIAAKIGIVDDIAYQTNLLALNAAIEAARAGEHGKGFAVVAAEVRKLAERSQVAAAEIGELAGTSVTVAERAGKLLDEMVPSIRKTSDLVQEITASSEEQATGVSQINNAMNQLNQATQQNASASEELAATAEELSGQAEQLTQLMEFFTLKTAAAAPPSRRDSRPPAGAGKLRTAAPQARPEFETQFARF